MVTLPGAAPVEEGRSRREPLERAAQASDGKTTRRRQRSAWGFGGPALPPTSRRRDVFPARGGAPGARSSRAGVQGSGFLERMGALERRLPASRRCCLSTAYKFR